VDFLTLVKELSGETGTELTVKVTDVTLSPATSYGETTEHITRCIRWIQQAWIELQDDQKWDFMVAREQMPLLNGQTSYDIRQQVEDIVGTDVYDGIVPFVAPVDNRYIWVVNGASDPLVKQPCYYVPPEHFFGDRDRYINDQGQPYWYTIDRDNAFVIESAPTSNDWNIEFEYRLKPQTLSVNSDTPTGLPDKYHMLIVYWAMMDYADFDETDRQFKRAKRKYRRMLNKLRLQETREYTMPGVR